MKFALINFYYTNDIKLPLTKKHEKCDKLSVLKLNFIRLELFFKSDYAKQVVTYKILEITQMYMISCHKWN
jgi:hypothetical protein